MKKEIKSIGSKEMEILSEMDKLEVLGGNMNRDQLPTHTGCTNPQCVNDGCVNIGCNNSGCTNRNHCISIKRDTED